MNATKCYRYCYLVHNMNTNKPRRSNFGINNHERLVSRPIRIRFCFYVINGSMCVIVLTNLASVLLTFSGHVTDGGWVETTVQPVEHQVYRGMENTVRQLPYWPWTKEDANLSICSVKKKWHHVPGKYRLFISREWMRIGPMSYWIKQLWNHFTVNSRCMYDRRIKRC